MSRTAQEQFYYGIDEQARRPTPRSVPDARSKGFHGQTRLITVTPDAIIPSVNEPIEASGGSRRRRSDLFDSRGRRQCVTWETMTDEEREEVQRMKRKDEAFKTALCDAFKKFGFCPYGDACRFAHGDGELRLPAQPRGKAHPKYKTQLCDKFSTFGHCPYGPRCQFIHKLKKGLPLIQYERLLAAGQISPEREDENRLPLSAQASRRSTGVSPSRNRVDASRRLSFDRENSFTPRQNIPNAIYPKMEIINIERACKYADDPATKPAAPTRRRSVEFDDMRPAIDFSINQITRSASVQSLPNRGMIGDFRYIPMVQPPDPGEATVEKNIAQKKKVHDLSLIKEEPEENQSQQDGSPRTTRPNKRNQWPENAFGKKMDTISEDDKENNVSKQSRTNETELLVQSCDEELLAQGLYDYRYPDTPTDLVEQWKELRTN
ncbi:hypothetical protein V3C99_003621 [Haemonchus contortus]